jgi:uncharacterized membrane protein
MNNRTVGIIATVLTALVCGCAALFACIWGGLIAAGQPITTTVNGVETVQTVEPTIGYVLLCLSFLLILVPVLVGFFALRKKPAAATISDEPPPPAL